MEMNAATRELSSLHRAYNDCLSNQVRKFMSLTEAQRVVQAKKEPEFCMAEKRTWMEYMRREFPIEHENLDRLDENLFF